MTPTERVTKLAQSIYRSRNNEQNDVTGSELDNFLENTIDWVNEFLPELEKEAYWDWSRENDHSFGTVASTTIRTIDLDDDIRTVVKEPERPIYLVKNDIVIATFDVVSPALVRNPRAAQNEDRVAIVNRQLVFSRTFTADEVGAIIFGDVVYYLPALSLTDATLLDTVVPNQLIVLGVLKNQVLPDIVQGGLTASFTQKYADLLEGIKMENNLSSQAEPAYGEDFGTDVRGEW